MLRIMEHWNRLPTEVVESPLENQNPPGHSFVQLDVGEPALVGGWTR